MGRGTRQRKSGGARRKEAEEKELKKKAEEAKLQEEASRHFKKKDEGNSISCNKYNTNFSCISIEFLICSLVVEGAVKLPTKNAESLGEANETAAIAHPEHLSG